jgi:hypothetical protein
MHTQRISAVIAALFLLPLAGQAAPTTYTDNAGNYSTTTGYAGQGGGTPGFGAFHVTANTGAGTFLFTATEGEGDNGTPKPDTIDTQGRSFGFYSDGNAAAAVTISRAFHTTEPGAGIGAVGDSFALDFVTGYNDGGDTGLSGVSLLAGDTPVGAFQYHGDDYYTFNGTKVDPGYTNGALHLLYTITSPTTYAFACTGAITCHGTGTFAAPLTGFQVQQVNSANAVPAKMHPDHNGYFNNLRLTAAP